MAVRVNVKISKNKKNLVVIAVANTGYETENPEIFIPVDIAEKLGLYPDLPEKTRVEKYISPGGETKVYKVLNYVDVELVLPKSRKAKCDLVISEVGDETLLSDKLLSALRIVIVDPGKGLWQIRGEKKLRKSEW